VAGYARLTHEERLAHQKHAKTLVTAAVGVTFKDALQTEAEGFTNILDTRGGMSPKQVADWLLHPPVTLGEKEVDKLIAEIKLKAVRAAATDSVGGELSDKDWRTLAQSPEWLPWQVASTIMKPEVAMRLEEEIMRILANIPIERAKEYMSRRIVRRRKNKIETSKRGEKPKSGKEKSHIHKAKH
jgi:hypothetical protein